MNKQRQLKRWLWLGVAAVVIAGFAWALWPRPMEVETTRAERGTLTATVSSIDGRTRVKQVYVVSSPVDGELERITLQAGDPVDPATPIARIWPVASRPLDPRARADALAAADVARAEVTRAQATEQEAGVALEHAESERIRDDKLVASGAIPAAEAEHQRHQTEIRRRALEAARAATGEARAQLSRALASLGAGQPRGPTPAAIVNAPAAGRVLRVIRESAGPVAIGAPLVEVGDVTQLEIYADLLSSDAAQVRVGASARVTGWGGQPLTARVRRIEPAAFTKVSALGLEEQRVHVVLDLTAPPPPELGHDYLVDVAITVWQGKDVVRVSSTALFRDGDHWAVFVVRDGRARAAPVEIGASDGTSTAVTRGLDAGAIVIAQPSDTISSGSRVASHARS
ncbi:MAG TPA: HlyD family efflux transporter periplasmic adaptor subunit [Kofleriaceae bacterium]|nr:HlyD family efflux transporter periplasmic adaptor subunit [Kofleriaceae bacterium]